MNSENGSMASDKENADTSEGSQLGGKWLDILRVDDYGPDGKVTSKDLDDMVSDYQARTASKAPVVLGRVKANGSPVGTVDEIRRNGNVLQAKLDKIDPRVDQLYSKGVFKKRSVAIERTPQGDVSLAGVGLVSPQWNGKMMHIDNEATPSLDDLVKQTFGTQSIVFGEEPVLLSNIGRIRINPESVRVSIAAKTLASEKNITFGEALSRVVTVESSAAVQKSRAPRGRRSGVPVNPDSVKLTELTKQRANERSVTFSEALSEVAAEHPELTRDPFAPRRSER
jgi:hypothetical protein